jgi:hypothetical protein
MQNSSRPVTLGLIVLVAIVAGAIAGCGGSHHSKPGPLGSASNPVVAQGGEGSEELDSERSAGKSGTGGDPPGYQQLVERQKTRPRGRFTPCNLVTRAEAAAIIGRRLAGPIEAPQGPTCIYRSAARGRQFVTVAVQYVSIPSVARHVANRKRIRVTHRAGICGANGQPTLYMPLTGGRVLTIGAQCGIARQFAAKALARLR